MSSDPWDRSDDAEPVRSFFDGLRDADPTRGDDARAPGDGAASLPDRGSGDGRARGRSRIPAGRVPDVSDPATQAIQAATDLRDVTHVGPAREGRFGVARRVGTATGQSRRLDVRAHRVPDGDPAGFPDALADQLRRWSAVDGLDGVVPVVEVGGEDSPWAVTAGTGPRLADAELGTSDGLRLGIDLAATVAALHDRGVVHGGIDPGNVVVPRGRDRRTVLDNVGLVDVYRRYDDPTTVLDPRYAAPEYFGDGPGVVDRASDVYGLGTVCFRLLTGVAPFAGTPETVAERVRWDDPIPRPSHVAPRLPEAVDDVLRSATATDKFERYDTAADFRDALAAAAEDADD